MVRRLLRQGKLAPLSGETGHWIRATIADDALLVVGPLVLGAEQDLLLGHVGHVEQHGGGTGPALVILTSTTKLQLSELSITC